MTIPAVDHEIFTSFDKDFYSHRIQSLIDPTLLRFQKILKSYTLFNFFFAVLIVSELIYISIHLTLLVQSFVMALHLALIFATCFCYFTLRLYVQTRKTEKLIRLKTDFIQACRHLVLSTDETSEQHLMVAQACCRLASDLHDQEYVIYPCPSWIEFLSSSFEKLNCWCFWKDVQIMKEFLLQACIEEHILLVRSEPTDLEAHAGLANAYVMLSGLYIDPRLMEGWDEERWIAPQKYNEKCKQKFRSNAKRAIEEFKILSAYAPHDPWVHAQLAYSYRDLQMPEEEIRSYETILQLCPDDKETLFKLGKLYFEQGFNAKGLQVYQTLKRSNYNKAESLIHFYGAYSIQTFKS
jgi:tetratricopeptide (TPR) repeat protein